MTSFVVYDAETGRISSTGFAVSGASAAQQAGPGQYVLVEDGASDLNHYVLVGEIPVLALRPGISIPDLVTIPAGSEPVAISPPLPAGSFVTVNGGPALLSTAGEILHLPSEPGVWVYRIALPFPYRDADLLTVIVEA